MNNFTQDSSTIVCSVHVHYIRPIYESTGSYIYVFNCIAAPTLSHVCPKPQAEKFVYMASIVKRKHGAVLF